MWPLVSYAQWDEFKPGSVGRIVDRMEVRIDSEDPENKVGEILVKGMNVMLGYYKNPEATKAVMMPDGWMRTGDLGTLDKDGFLYIRGRSKTMILGPSGQNIYPEEIEDRLNNMLYVAESLIISQGGKLVALIYPDWEQVDKAGIQHSEIEKLMQTNIDQVNEEMPITINHLFQAVSRRIRENTQKKHQEIFIPTGRIKRKPSFVKDGFFYIK